MPRKKQLDERQIKFLSFYLNPNSETYMSVRASALKSKFSESYADNLTHLLPDWLSENIGKRKSMLVKAERNLDNMLDLETKQLIITMVGVLKDGKGNEIKKENPNLLRVKADVSKFVAERLGKKDYGKEDEGKGDTYNTIIFAGGQINKIARRVLDGGESSKTKPD